MTQPRPCHDGPQRPPAGPPSPSPASLDRLHFSCRNPAESSNLFGEKASPISPRSRFHERGTRPPNQASSVSPSPTMISLDEFNDIYNQHIATIFCATLRAVSRREIAEEITSEVFLTLFQSAETVAPDQLPAWLFTVAKRRTADYWRCWYLEQRWADDTHASDLPSDP